ncbi:MAG TPA: hypothetical protein VFA49_00770 [Chloroflexota bacterium]|nr:hypothetical protein [Chloroflexota bacterium]
MIDFGWSQYERYPFSFGNPAALPPVEHGVSQISPGVDQLIELRV